MSNPKISGEELRQSPAPMNPLIIRYPQFFSSQPHLLKVASLSAVSAIALMLLGGTAWRAYSDANMIPIAFETISGDSVSVTAVDASGNRFAAFTAPAIEVLLPGNELRLDVIAPQRLGYQRSIDPAHLRQNEFTEPMIVLKEPQSHRWMLDDVLWYENRDINRNLKSSNHCIVLRSDGLALIETRSGKILWTFQDPDKIEWGHSVRGCPATFQPDRCAVINDTNGNGSQEIVFAHPNKAELLCLDSLDGRELWRHGLFESSLIQAATALCPIVIQEFPGLAGGNSSLGVVFASHDFQSALLNRWLVNMDPSDGSVRWLYQNQLMPKVVSNSAVMPISSRPLHLHWGQIEKRSRQRGSFVDNNFYFNGYSGTINSVRQNDPNETSLRLGTERPFPFEDVDRSYLCWIDGEDLQIVDPQTGELFKEQKLLDDCVCAPKLIRNSNGKTILLTVHATPAWKTSEYVGSDLETNQEVWKQTVDGNLNRLPQSYFSREQDFPVIVDLDRDGIDEWIVPIHTAGAMWSHPMTPPYGSVMAHRGDNGKAFWEKPFHLPNLDGMIERAIAVSDVDGDGWKDLLFGTRFHGGGVREGVGCFVDLVSGKTGQRIWYSNVRTESTKRSKNANEFVNMSVLEERGLIAVETSRGDQAFQHEFARPNSMTFLDIATGKEQAFGLGLSARAFGRDTWLEHRIPTSSSNNPANRPQPGKLYGWDYCLSSAGDLIWHRPPIPPLGEIVATFEVMNRKYFCVQSPSSSPVSLDVTTGEECDAFRGLPISFVAHFEGSTNGNLILWEYSNHNRLSAMRPTSSTLARKTKPQVRTASDPRYVRLFPWAIHAKSILSSGREALGPYSLSRILKLAIGVFFVPLWVAWFCVRRQFSIRHLLLVATAIAVALALVVADKNAFPTDGTRSGFVGAMVIAGGAVICIVILTMPFIELGRSRWRRILSSSLYGVFLLSIPVFNLLAYPSAAIETTYTFQESWHLFWLALIPTGFILLMLVGMRTVGKVFFYLLNGLTKLFKKTHRGSP